MVEALEDIVKWWEQKEEDEIEGEWLDLMLTDMCSLFDLVDIKKLSHGGKQLSIPMLNLTI